MPRPSVITEEIGKEIVSLYESGKSIREVVRETGVPRTSVRRWIIGKCTVRTCREASRRLFVDGSSFKRITEESAYWIGFLMADGCVSQGYSKSIILALQYRDREHVIAFKKFLKSEHEVSTVKSKNSIQARIAITSDDICDDIGSFGVVPRKTYTAKALRGIDSNRHFWRGVVDGDGCLMISDVKKQSRQEIRITLNGCKLLLEQFREYTKTIYSHNASVVRGHGEAWQISLFSNAAQAIVSHLYQGNFIALRRKKIIANAIISHECGAAKRKDH